MNNNTMYQLLQYLSLPSVWGASTALLLAFLAVGFAPSAEAAMSRQLDIGSEGTDVSTYQMYLAKNPNVYPSGLVTGYFGPLTMEATQKFQANQGIVTEGSPETTGFGRVGPVTLARVNSLMGGGTYVGGGAMGDVYAPTMSTETVTVGENQAVFSWTTNEAAMSRVMYATSWPFLYASTAGVRSTGYGTTATIVISNLRANTMYYYVRESVDASGNIMWTEKKTFKTDL